MKFLNLVKLQKCFIRNTKSLLKQKEQVKHKKQMVDTDRVLIDDDD